MWLQGIFTGRSDDMLIIRGVNVFPSQLEELILTLPELAPTYQLIVTREGHLDQLQVNVEVRPQDPGVRSTEWGDLGRELQHKIKTHVGISAKVWVLEPDTIERSLVGKAKRVIDNRPKA